MDWYQNLYVGKNAEKKRDALIRDLEAGKDCPLVLLIIEPPGPDNQLEILSASDYIRQEKRKGPSLVAGLAVGKREARELVRRIVEDAYQAIGSPNVRAYLHREHDPQNSSAGEMPGEDIGTFSDH